MANASLISEILARHSDSKAPVHEVIVSRFPALIFGFPYDPKDAPLLC